MQICLELQNVFFVKLPIVFVSIHKMYLSQCFKNIFVWNCQMFLAVQNSSTGDLVTHSLTIWLRTIPDICHGYHGSYPWQKNLPCEEISNFCTWQMWKNMKFLHMWIKFKFLHVTDVECFQISSHYRCEEIWNLLNYVYNLWHFVAFYTVFANSVSY